MDIIDYAQFPANVLVQYENGKKEIIRFRLIEEEKEESLWSAASTECGCYAFINNKDEYKFQPYTLSTDIVTNITQFKNKLWKN